MRIDLETVPFSAVSIAGVSAILKDFDLQNAEAFAVLIEITAHGGTATNTFLDLIPRIGSTILTGTNNGEVIGHTADIVATTGLFALTKIGLIGAAKTQYLAHDSYLLPASFREWRVRAVGVGAGHTITGNVYIFRRFR